MKRLKDSGWSSAFKAAGKWVGVASVVTVPTAFLLPDPWDRSPIPLILWIVVGAVPVLLPVVSGCYYRSVKVAVAVAIIGITIGCAVLAIIIVLSLASGFAGFVLLDAGSSCVV
jgi:hypothetical protein